jgi:hypothetical protein
MERGERPEEARAEATGFWDNGDKYDDDEDDELSAPGVIT